MSNLDEFWSPGTFDPTEEWPANERTLHLAGLDGIDPAYDAGHSALTGIIGFDPADYIQTSEETQLDIEQNLPQWGPPFVKFVDGRITDLEKKVNKAIEKWQFETQTFVIESSFNTDGVGNVGSNAANAPVLIQANPGWTYAVHRYIILLDGSNFGTPFTIANGYWELRYNGVETVDGGSLTSGQGSLPVVKTYGTRDALRVRDGENLTFFLFNASATKRVTVKLQCSVDRTIEG